MAWRVVSIHTGRANRSCNAQHGSEQGGRRLSRVLAIQNPIFQPEDFPSPGHRIPEETGDEDHNSYSISEGNEPEVSARVSVTDHPSAERISGEKSCDRNNSQEHEAPRGKLRQECRDDGPWKSVRKEDAGISGLTEIAHGASPTELVLVHLVEVVVRKKGLHDDLG